MADALGSAPTAALEVPFEERVNRWIEDEPDWASPLDAIEALTSFDSAPDVRMVERWKQLSQDGRIDLVTSVLGDYIDQCHSARTAQRSAKAGALASLMTDSLKPERLADTVRAWQPGPEVPAA